MNRFIFIFGLIILVFLASLSLAGIPKMINYQGMLTGPDGKTPVTNGNYSILFSIYNTSSGGSSLWSHTYNVSVTNGLFNIILGDSGAPINLAFDTTYWLGIKVGADPQLSPRIRLTSVGYAYRAWVADSATVAVSAPTGGGWTDVGRVVKLQTSTDSVGIGTTSPAAKLDVNGDVNTGTSYKIGGNRVLSNPGTENIFLGVNAGENNTGINATFVGYRAGYKNEGEYNTFYGHMAGYGNTTGFRNTFTGHGAGFGNITGSRNTFLGDGAGGLNSTGDYNTYVGQGAGSSNTSGGNNTFVGLWAGSLNTTGSCNTSIGAAAGQLDSAGSGNVFIGYQAALNEQGSNKLYIANSNADPPLIYGDFSSRKIGIGTISPGCALHVLNSSSYFGMLRVQNSNLGNNEATIGFIGGGEVAHETWLAGVGPWGTGRNFVIGLANPKLLIDTVGNVGIGTASPAYKLDVEGYVQAYGYNTGDIIFQKDKEKLWRMYEDEDGLYLENLKTGKTYRFVLQEVEKK